MTKVILTIDDDGSLWIPKLYLDQAGFTDKVKIIAKKGEITLTQWK